MNSSPLRSKYVFFNQKLSSNQLCGETPVVECTSCWIHRGKIGQLSGVLQMPQQTVRCHPICLGAALVVGWGRGTSFTVVLCERCLMYSCKVIFIGPHRRRGQLLHRVTTSLPIALKSRQLGVYLFTWADAEKGEAKLTTSNPPTAMNQSNFELEQTSPQRQHYRNGTEAPSRLSLIEPLASRTRQTNYPRNSSVANRPP